MPELDPIERLLPAPLRAALARRELIVRRPLVGARHGVHRSLRPGVGRDFRDYRPYVAGDDPRRLDWRAAARSQRLVVRQTESEDELDLVLIADGSGGMAYGTETGNGDDGGRSKWGRAGTIAAAIASLAIRQGDRVGLAIGRGGRLELDALEPTSRRDRLRHVAERFTSEPDGDCDWPSLLDAVAPRLRRRTLVVVLSDFLDPGGTAAGTSTGTEADEALLRGLTLLRSAGHDLALVQILHRDELEFPWDRQRVIELEDPRGRRPTVEGPGASIRDDYLARLAEHLRWLEVGCERGGLLLTRMVTDADPVTQLLDLLARLGGQPSDAVTHEGAT